MSAPILRDYQRQALDAVDAAVARGVLRQLIALPTGTGKTIVFAEVIRRRGGRALVLAHRDELLGQSAEKIRRVSPGAQLGLVKGPSDETSAQIVVASVQTLARRARLARLAGNFNTVVVDEAHHSAASSYRRILEHVGAFRDNGPLVLGVTATPDRADGAALVGDLWQEIVYSAGIVEMIEAGYLADMRAIRVRLEVDLDQVHVRGGDLVPSELEDVMRNADAAGHVADAFDRFAPERKALLFAPTVATAHDMAEAFRATGYSAEALDGSTPPDERRGILRRLRDGETRVVTNCAVLTEGFDEPSIDCIVIARPTTSRPLYAQMIGRGTRLHPGKQDCLILDLVGSTSRHSLMSASVAFGLPADALDHNRTVGEAAAGQRADAARYDAQGQLVAQTVDLFNRRKLHWGVGDARCYTLALGEGGLLTLTSNDLLNWTVTHHRRDRTRVVLADGLDLGFGQGTAEDFARRMGAHALNARDASWRREPASQRQIDALKRWRIPVPPGMTRGEASDLIAAAVGRVA